MLISLRFLLLLLVYLNVNVQQANGLESDTAEDVLTKVLGEVRSKIIDSKNLTKLPQIEPSNQPKTDIKTSESTKKDGEVLTENDNKYFSEAPSLPNFDSKMVIQEVQTSEKPIIDVDLITSSIDPKTTTSIPDTTVNSSLKKVVIENRVEKLNQKAKKLMEKKLEKSMKPQNETMNDPGLASKNEVPIESKEIVKSSGKENGPIIDSKNEEKSSPIIESKEVPKNKEKLPFIESKEVSKNSNEVPKNSNEVPKSSNEVPKIDSKEALKIDSKEVPKTFNKSSLKNQPIDFKKSSIQQKSSNENFVANFVVQPEFQGDHKPKIEFAPHFERKVFEFMVPEGENSEESLVAIVPFYSSVDSKIGFKFKLVNDSQGWFSIGKVNHTMQEIYAVDFIQILLNADSKVLTKAAGLNGIYAIGIEASQSNEYKTKAGLQVEILALTDDSVEMADLILSRLELSDSTQNQTMLANGTENLENIRREDEDKVVLDFANKSSENSTLLDEISEENGVIEYPEIKLELRGVQENSMLAVSESLQNGDSVPDFGVHLSTEIPFDEIAILEIEPKGIFVLRPQFLLPNEESRLIVVNSTYLDFDKNTKPFEIMITAKFVDSNAATQTSLIVEKLNEPDHSPKFEKSEYTFHVSESAENNTVIGKIMALDDDSKNGKIEESQIQYTLLGSGSQNFQISNGSLILNCFADFSTECLDYEQTKEYNFLAMAVDKNGLSSEAVPITILVSDANDNGPILEVFDNEIEISDSEIRSPYLFAINDLDSPKNQENLVELSNDAARFLSLERLSSSLYQIQVSRSSPIGLYHLDITVRDSRGENLSQKTRVRVNVLSSIPKVMFRRQKYERTINIDNIQTGNSITQPELDGADIDTIRFMVLEGNPGWLAVEDYSGNVYVGELPSNGVESGKFVTKIAAIDRDSQRILSTCELQLTVQGKNSANSRVFQKPLTTLFVGKDSIKEDLKVTMVNEFELKLVELGAYDDDLLSIDVEKNSIRVENGQVIIKKELLQMANSINFKLGVEGLDETAVLQIFSTRDPEKVKELENALSIPKFSSPWINEKTVIQLRVQEELPTGHTILCMPALNQLDGSLIKNVELSGDGSEYFKLNSINGCLLIQKRIDFEQLPTANKNFNLELKAKLNNQEVKAKIQIQIVDLDDNAPELQFLTPHALKLMENPRIGQKIVEILVLDKDHIGKNQQFQFKLSGLQAENFQVRVHEQNQSILVLTIAPGSELDREQNEEIAFKLTVTDMAGNSNDLPIKIQIEDANDNKPQFTKTSAEIDVFDNWPEGMELFAFNAYDLDFGNNSRITYSLDQNADFEIDSNSGVIQTSNTLSGLARPEPYIIGILAIDQGNPPQSAMAELYIHIHEATGLSNVDSQEIRIVSPPVDFQLNLTENLPARSLIYTVEAITGMPSDSMENDLVHYSLEAIDSSDEGWLTIDENTGDLHLLHSLDFEQQPYITVG